MMNDMLIRNNTVFTYKYVTDTINVGDVVIYSVRFDKSPYFKTITVLKGSDYIGKEVYAIKSTTKIIVRGVVSPDNFNFPEESKVFSHRSLPFNTIG